MSNKLFFIVFMVMWIVLYNIMTFYISKDYYKVSQIILDTQEYVNDEPNTSNYVIPKYLGILENDLICEINVVNSVMMNKIITNIEFSNTVYYTKFNSRTELCEVPITWIETIVEKIFLIISIGMMSFMAGIGIVIFVLKLQDCWNQCDEDCGIGGIALVNSFDIDSMNSV